MFTYNKNHNRLDLAFDFPEDMTLSEALEASIGKWKAIIQIMEVGQHYPEDGGMGTCALCHMFYVDDSVESFCSACPIKQATGRDTCDGTPYVAYSEARKQEDHSRMIEAAYQELAFLEDLLEYNEYIVRLGHGPLKGTIHIKKAYNKEDALAQIHEAFTYIKSRMGNSFKGSKISFDLIFDHKQVYSDDIEEV